MNNRLDMGKDGKRMSLSFVMPGLCDTIEHVCMWVFVECSRFKKCRNHKQSFGPFPSFF